MRVRDATGTFVQNIRYEEVTKRKDGMLYQYVESEPGPHRNDTIRIRHTSAVDLNLIQNGTQKENKFML